MKNDSVFAGSIAQLYDEYMVPMLFDAYAADVAPRVVARRPQRVLEVAAGTGAVTRALARALPASVEIIATDLNQSMLDRAMEVGTVRPVEWKVADALHLPFDDESFDTVVCQFGAMFFPDKPAAFAEAHRVLRPGGLFLANVWDDIRHNEFADEVMHALAAFFPDDPPRFMVRTPHGYFDRHLLARDIAAGGFTMTPHIETIAVQSRVTSARVPAIAICQGTPMRNEILGRGADLLGAATDACATALEKRFGSGEIEGKIQAVLVTVEK